jgi:uncharacterized repeat protein (TIGR01451 family)
MIFTKQTVSLLAGIVLFWSGGAQAADSLQLTNEVFQEIEVKGADGKVEKKMVPAAKVVPGTEVLYVITYKNIGKKTADNVAITNPVPKELEYINEPKGKTEAAPELSVDGGKNYGELSHLKMTGPDGKSREARASDVTHLRWHLGSAVNPGEKGTVSFHARLK